MSGKLGSFFRDYLPDISLFLSTVVWGLSFTIMKAVLGNQISPYLFVFLRFSISSLLLYPMCRTRLPSLGGPGIGIGIVLGLLIYLGFITQAVGIVFTTASKSAFITGLSSIFVPFFLIAHRRRVPDPVVIAALALAGVGMFLLTDPAGGEFNFGDILTLMCAVSFAAQIYLMGLATLKHDTLALTFVELAATAALAGAALPFAPIHFVVTWETITALAFMAIIGTALALSVQTWAQKRTPAVRAGLIYSAEPVFAYVFAAAILGESFSSMQKIGSAIIILAVVLSELLPPMIGRGREIAQRRA